MKATDDLNTESGAKNWTRHLPTVAIPYAELARFDRPIGWWLLVLPCWWTILSAGLSMDAPPIQAIKLMALFLIGSIAMRGAGCIINDLWDRDLDRAVARTRNRALASGAVTPLGALVFLAVLSAIGLLVLVQLPLIAIWWGLMSLPLIIIYPLAKRFISLPQIVLSLTFSWGALLGWAAFGTAPGSIAGVLYLAVAFWIFGYDTIYAIQDMADDRKAGIKSSALTLGRHLKPAVAFCYTMMVLGLILAGALRQAEWVYYLGIAAAAIQLRRQTTRLMPDANETDTAAAIFRSNRNTGLILTLALLVELMPI
jgi:4-hydroxybenzoate polyprenyltransferase